MRTALIVSLSLCWSAGMAVAQTAAPTAPKPPEAAAPAARPAEDAKKPAPEATKRGKAGDGGEKKAPEKPAGLDALGSCLEMWEPSTHMTRQQWARACRRVAERLKDLTVK
jgi:hypothetical protein